MERETVLLLFLFAFAHEFAVREHDLPAVVCVAAWQVRQGVFDAHDGACIRQINLFFEYNRVEVVCCVVFLPVDQRQHGKLHALALNAVGERQKALVDRARLVAHEQIDGRANWRRLHRVQRLVEHADAAYGVRQVLRVTRDIGACCVIDFGDALFELACLLATVVSGERDGNEKVVRRLLGVAHRRALKRRHRVVCKRVAHDGIGVDAFGAYRQ